MMSVEWQGGENRVRLHRLVRVPAMIPRIRVRQRDGVVLMKAGPKKPFV